MGITPKSTTQHTISGASVAYPNLTGNPQNIRVCADRNAHIRMGSDTDSVTPQNGMPIACWNAEVVSLGTGRSIHYILAEGDVAGKIWFTVV